MRLRTIGFLTALSGLAFILSACPAANGYVGTTAFPNIRLDSMVGMHAIPGDDSHAAVLGKDGIVYRASLTNAAEEPSVFLDIRARLINDPGQEEGLLGLAFAPDFATSGAFFVHYTAGGPRRSVISRFVASGGSASAGTESVVLEQPQPYANHNGGGLAFGPDGMLYVAFGDGGSGGDPQGNAQNLDTLLGKILRIDVGGDGYTIPADNPFVGRGGRDEVWAYGLRNPWRITFDRETGALWTGDVGQGEWEEVDRIVPGANYGWNILEGDDCYNARACDRSRSLAPRATYSHDFGCSISGGYVYRGAAMPELRGWYVYGDFCSGRVWAVDAGNNEGAAIPLADTGLQITSFFEAADGELYIVSIDDGIHRLDRKPQ